MPVGYGSNIPLSELLTTEVGTTIPTTNTAWTSWLRIGLTILEVGLSLIPGIGPEVATGIALAGAAGSTAIDASTGQISPTNIAVNFGSAIIPGVSAGIKNVIQVGKAVKFTEQASSDYGGIIKDAIEGQQLAQKQISQIIDYGNGLNEGFIQAGVSPEQAGRLVNQQLGGQLQNASNLFKQSSTNLLTAQSSQHAFDSVVLRRNPFVDPFKSVGKQTLNDLVQGQGIRVPISEMKTSINSVASAGRRFAKGATGVGEGIEGGEEDLRRILTKSGFTEAELLQLEKLIGTTSDAATRQSITLDFLRSIGGVDRARQFAVNYTDSLALQQRLKQLARLEEGTPKPEGWKKFWHRYVNAIKHPAGAEFNDMIVQPVQAIFDAGDLGRAPIEFAYKKLKKAISKEMSKITRWAGKAEKLESAFEKAGGIVIQDRAILGYKIIETIGAESMIQIAFRPGLSVDGAGTGAKHARWGGKKTKNFGGKKPVYVKASKLQLERLTTEGMNYYLKKWAYSRGGRPLGISAFGLGGLTAEAEMILPFINTGLMRNMLSLSSNIVQNVTKTAMGTGGYATGWETKFLGSFQRSWKNRGGRLFANAIVGEAAGVFLGKRVGVRFGKEAQRVFSAMTTTINMRAATQQPTNTFGHQFTRLLMQKEMQGTVSHLKALAGQNNRVVQSMNASRKLGFVQRIPSSASGGKFALTNFKIGV